MNNLIGKIKICLFVFFKLFLQGNISFNLAVLLMTPGKMHLRTKAKTNYLFYKKPIVGTETWNLELTDFIHQIVVLNQYHVELIDSKGVVIDAGANIGIFSIFAAIKHPDATIYAFEPTPSTFKSLKENTKYYPNIKIFNCGLAETKRDAFITTFKHSGKNYVGETGTPIELKTIDEFNIPASFIKIDTEGYEENILNGAKETIRKFKPIISMSAYHKVTDKYELPKTLNKIAPYSCELVHDGEEDFICKPVL